MMTYDPTKQHRRSICLKHYDYTQVGAYFVTICTQSRECLFGDVVDGEMQVNAYGRIVKASWDAITIHFPLVALDAFVVMPNHIHSIIVLNDRPVGARHAVPLRNIERYGNPIPGSIPTIIRSFKSVTTKRINEMRGTPAAFVWQRNYYEHIVRDEETLYLIRQYVADNPLNWTLDRENPLCDETKDLKTQKGNKWEV